MELHREGSAPAACAAGFFSTMLVPIRIFVIILGKYLHLHTNILVFFNLPLFIVNIFAQIRLKKVVSVSDSVCVCVLVHDCCLHCCTCNILILTV